MCDTLCVAGSGRTLFGKNSDRPPDEVQLVEAYPRRPGGGRVRTQYLEIDDSGAYALVGSRPSWLWGFEHGVNEHGLAIGNEAVHTVDRPRGRALIGMDLVRLGLERATTAADGVDVIATLLERHGQGGPCHESGWSYCSSFLLADPTECWVLETSGTTWAARRSTSGGAISNRLSLRSDWTKASSDVRPGDDFDGWRDATTDTGYADVRLDVSRAFVSGGATDPAAMAGLLRDHAGGDPGERMSICMHVRGISNSTASMIADLVAGEPPRAWFAIGNPCVSIYVPGSPAGGVPGELGDVGWWRRFAALRDRVERDPSTLAAIRAELDPVEAASWSAGATWAAVAAALERLGVVD